MVPLRFEFNSSRYGKTEVWDWNNRSHPTELLSYLIHLRLSFGSIYDGRTSYSNWFFLLVLKVFGVISGVNNLLKLKPIEKEEEEEKTRKISRPALSATTTCSNDKTRQRT